jgi:hypothetical protein
MAEGVSTCDLVKPIVGVLTSRTDLLEGVLADFKKYFGEADVIGEWRAFDHTDYYAPEMGEGLQRCFVSFEKLMRAADSRGFKSWTNAIEEKYSRDGKRVVNLDAGYIDANKVVLISGKHGGHKIVTADGIWADMLLWYNKGWDPLPWAFPDFRDGGYFQLFTAMRKKFKEQVRMSFHK